MKSLLTALSKQGGSAILVLVILILLAWFGGESAGVSKKVRAGAVAVLLLAGLGLVVAQKVQTIRGALQIENKLKEQAQEQVQSARPDLRPEVQAVQQQLNEAIQALKASRLGKGALYALPWYMIIGPPGSGKSTALQESGLNFPYVSQGRKGIRGVGGTRNCDWWFTDEGILLDTAGRYTTEIDDREEWITFLDMIKKARKHKPVNGAIVAVSIADLLNATEEELEAHAKNIRDRIDELTKHLEIVFPVYLLFTKCDLLQGFVEFFEDFGRGDRAQVWGCTLPFTGTPPKTYREIFEEECRKLLRSLGAQRLSVLAGERPSSKKQNIYLFPLQFQMALKRLGDFVAALFRPNPFQESSLLRGFYFTSGTQEGTPIDQVIRSLSQAFGLKEEGGGMATQPADKKSYFINHLFTKIIFPDQTLARTSMRIQRRRKLLHYGTLGLSAVGSLVLLAGLATSFFKNRGLVGSTREAVEAARPVNWAAPASPSAALEVLEKLRGRLDRLDQYDRQSPPRPLTMGLGLYQGDSIHGAARKAYFAALKDCLVRPAAAALEDRMKKLHAVPQRSSEEDAVLGDLYAAYKILGGELPVKSDRDRKLVVSVLTGEGKWGSKLGSGPLPLAEAQLQFFAHQLQLGRAAGGLVTPDLGLIAQVERDLAETGFISGQYRDIVTRRGKEAGNVTVDAYAKPKAGTPPLLKSAYTLSGLFTQLGRKTIVESEIEDRSKSLSEDYARRGMKKTPEEIAERLRGQYERQYEVEWDRFRESIQLDPFPHLKGSVERMKVLTAEDSPYYTLFSGVFKDLAPKGTAGELELGWIRKALGVLYALHVEVGNFASEAPENSRIIASERPKRVTELLAKFVQARRELEEAINPAAPAHKPWGRLLRQVIDNAWRALATEAQNELEKRWDQEVSGVYKAELKGKYPFDEASKRDASLVEFSKLFHPAGKFWAIQRLVEDLRKLRFETVDAATRLPVEEPLVRTTQEYDAAVKKAQGFLEIHPAAASDKISVVFKAKLQPGHGRVTGVKLEVGEDGFIHDREPEYTKQMTWTEGKTKGAKLSIQLAGATDWSEMDAQAGDWGLMKLIGSGTPQVLGEKQFACTWVKKIDYQGSKDDYKALLTLEVLARVNPFRKGFFSEFACPEKVGP